MCQQCEEEYVNPRTLPLDQRSVPYFSGEAAIYSPEYLERKEGNAKGVSPGLWRYVC